MSRSRGANGFGPPGNAGYGCTVADILIASDAPWVVEELRAAVEGLENTIRSVRTGEAVAAAVDRLTPDLVVLDLQIGNMGGMATCVHLHLEADAGRLPAVPILMLLDRRPDVFLARRSGADGFVIKPLDPMRLRRAVRALLAGDTYEDPTGMPAEIPGPAAVG
jgi:DNA-binding NarL/FixJ family response regulator